MKVPIVSTLVLLGLMLAGLAVGPAFAQHEPDAELRYTGDFLGDVSGGLQRGFLGMGRLDLTLDSGDGFMGISGLHAFTDIFLLHGGGFSQRYVGDTQIVSNVDAPYALRPFEAWLEASVGKGLRLKAGLIDVNSEFDVQQVGALFLSSSFGIAPDFSQSGLNGPSIFPVTSPGLLFAIERPQWTVRAALLDGLPGDPLHSHNVFPSSLGRDGALLVMEGERKIGDGELQLGSWFYTSKFDRLDGRGRGQSAGQYIQYEQTLAGDEQTGLWRGWARMGTAAPGVNPIGLYVGGGFTYGTDDARYGIAIAHARLGDHGRRAFAAASAPNHAAETAIEVTATRKLAYWLTLQPDVQYVAHPSWGIAPNALVVGLRLHLHCPL
jgi:porin